MQSFLTVTLNPALDVFKSNTCKYTYAGGKGINVARALKKWGADVRVFSVCGGDSGKKWRVIVEKEFKYVSVCGISGETRINEACLNNLALRRLNTGPDLIKSEKNNILKSFRACLRKVDIVVISGSLPGNTSVDFYENLIAQSDDHKIIVDVSGSFLRRLLLVKPFLVKPNKEELEECLSVELNSREVIIDSVYQLKKMGAQNVILSLGSEGAVGLLFNQLYWFKGEMQNFGYDVGCGDVLLGTFLAHLNNDLFDAFKLSVATSSASMKHLKPGYFRKKDIKLNLVENIS